MFFTFLANSHENVTECLRTLLRNDSEVNSVVSEAITEGGEKPVAACYLHDFTHMVYKPRSEEEAEVMAEFERILIIKLSYFIMHPAIPSSITEEANPY